MFTPPVTGYVRVRVGTEIGFLYYGYPATWPTTIVLDLINKKAKLLFRIDGS